MKLFILKGIVLISFFLLHINCIAMIPPDSKIKIWLQNNSGAYIESISFIAEGKHTNTSDTLRIPIESKKSKQFDVIFQDFYSYSSAKNKKILVKAEDSIFECDILLDFEKDYKLIISKSNLLFEETKYFIYSKQISDTIIVFFIIILIKLLGLVSISTRLVWKLFKFYLPFSLVQAGIIIAGFHFSYSFFQYLIPIIGLTTTIVTEYFFSRKALLKTKKGKLSSDYYLVTCIIFFLIGQLAGLVLGLYEGTIIKII